MGDDDKPDVGLAALVAAAEFADRVDVGLVAHGPDGSIIGVNRAACGLLGLTRDQMLGRTSMDSRWGAVHEDGSPFPGDDHPAMVTLRTGAPCIDVVMGVDATGFQRRWIAIRTAPVDFPDLGVAVVAMFVDVGARVRTAHALAETRAELERAEARNRTIPDRVGDPSVRPDAVGDESRAILDALVESRERLRSALDAMFDPQAYLEPVTDAEGRVVDFVFADANHATLEFLDTTSEELVGTRLGDALPSAAQSGFLGLCAQLHATGDPMVLDGFSFAEATPASAGRHFDIRGTRVAGGITLTWREVLDRGTAPAEASVLDERYRLLVDHTSEAIFQIGMDGTIEWASPGCAAVLGWEPHEVIGMRNIDLVHPDDLEWFRVETARLVLTGDQGRFTVRVRRKDDSYRWVEAASSRVDRAGRPPLRVVRLRDAEREIEALHTLAESERRYRLLAENATDVIVHIVDQRVAWVSPSIERVFGWSPDAAAQVDVAEVVHPDDLGLAVESIRRVRSGERVVERLRVRGADGEVHWVEAHGGPYRDEDGAPDGVLVTARIVDAEVAAFRTLDRLAHFDPVTGVINRAEALHRLGERLSDRRRRGPFGVLYCDVDRFKEVNDSLGHAVGDLVLRTLAQRLAEALRADDVVARIGGDEFIVILDGPIDLDDATRVAEKLRGRALEVIAEGDVAYSPSISIGATVNRETDDADSLLARADGAMYRAKEAGRNRVVGAA